MNSDPARAGGAEAQRGAPRAPTPAGATPEHLRTVVDAILQSEVSVMLTTAQGIIQFVNPAFERRSGYSAAEAVGQTPSLLKSGAHSAEFFSRLRKAIGRGEVFRAVFTNQSKNGELYFEDKTITPIRNAGTEISHYLATGHLLAAQPVDGGAGHAADHDALTLIPNRLLFMNRLRRAIDRSQRDSRQFALLHIDLDRFKRINDTLGHTTGDQILTAVAQRIGETVCGQHTVARLGGDEFTVIAEGLADRHAVDRLAESLIGECSRPFEIAGRTLYAGISVGIAAYPQDGLDIESLLRHAEIAMYQAKSSGRGIFVNFSAEMEQKMLEDLSLEGSLRRALANGEFEVFYQAIVSPGDGQAVGLEALLRWHSPQHGEVPPVRFIPMLEEIGLITTVGRWVLQTACSQFKAMAQRGLAPAILAVNLSGHQFREATLVDDVQAILQATGLAPSQLELEITESVLIEDASAAGKTLHALAALGVHLAIDDFGTGYSSLSYLRRFPINTLKIDRSFVSEMESSVDAEVIVKSIISLAHNLGIEVVAEGVENAGQLERLAQLGCARVQGFLFGRPAAMADLEIRLTPPFAQDEDSACCAAPAKSDRSASLTPCNPIQASGQIMKTIFLVDDSATILLSISSILGKAGYAVEKAANAEIALSKFNAGVKIDLLITDLNMPGMNGIELIREVRKLPAYKFVPILFLTTESQQSKKQEAKAAGASGWIVKPATADELLNTIKLVLR